MLTVATAGWAIPRARADAFPEHGSSLKRYAARFAGVEINSSFHRPHRRSTYERWAGTVPEGFRFSVKLPKVISHERKLHDCGEPLARFLDEVGGLSGKLAVLLLQLPPKLAFDAAAAESFLRHLIDATPARLVCEPRHPSWFDGTADSLLRDLTVARVAADPAIVPTAAIPAGWGGLVYRRLHGSPTIYRSSYDNGRLLEMRRHILDQSSDGPPHWYVFDNTASGAATQDALNLVESLSNP